MGCCVEPRGRPIHTPPPKHPQRATAVEPGVRRTHSLPPKNTPTASYHKDAAKPTLYQLSDAGVAYSVLGGGRINHDSGAQTVHIYGFSYGFPWADDAPRHDISAALVREQYPEYEVTTSDEGY